MSILDSIRLRNGLPVSRNNQSRETQGFSAQQRKNFVALGNTIELGTEILFELLHKTDGLSGYVGDQRLFKRDIADMIGGKLAARIQQKTSTDNGGVA
ncbi:hypothetical protein WELLINGTON_268 [Erwinia phage Wellington]|jgi:hypothetical protein|uniref:Uncharacterized protein n=2 Tax=Wellingtonvirus wellington TaxID=2734153 RepID=A0A1B2IEC1_9CAUD|nr:hypothetical protein BIZ80_gp031 [Erwinia phage vB_EamM_Kwan]YP_009806752.1 hypothetical protein HOT70_gp033 [Erwinia phage Wellington]ANZ49620.1 hypothetical protein KWAN_268 [Erwinia phage vB_EamM_Kwan]AXF51394.1 hypothetical protein WELLINGTON_268 [Erwinia phage Wellington]